MLACANTEKRHTSRQMCNLFSATMQQFGIAKENILCLVVDNASNMTKTIERLNEDDPEVESDTPQDEAADESENYDDIEDDCAMRVNIHHMHCAVHTLQLAIKDGLKLPNCDKLLTKTRHIVTKLLSPNILSLLEKRGKKRPILDMTTRWASTYLMIKRLLELRESIGELSLLSPELHISLAMWSSLDDIGSVLEMPYSVTVNLQAESLTPGAFLKEWCALKRILHKRETRLAEEIVSSMEKREEALLRNKLFLAGVFVDSRYQILLTPQQMENAKIGIHEITLKNYHCSRSVSKLTSSSIESEKVPDCVASHNQSSTSEDDEFERELDLIEQRRSSSMRSNANDVLNKTTQELNKNIEKMIEIGQLKGETVWDVIKQLEEPLLTTAKILSAMPVTQVSVERLFSSMKFILSDQRLSMTQELLESILYLRANAER